MTFVNRTLRAVLAVLALALLHAGTAEAQNTVTFTFAGYLADVDASLSGVFSVGDPFFGTVTYDLDAVDQLPDNTDYGIYNNLVSFSCVINGTHQAQADQGHVNLPVGNVMDWLVDGGFTGDTAAGMTPQFVNIPLFENQSDPVLTTDQMPSDPFPSMQDFGSAEFRIRFGPTWNENEVRGPITLDSLPTPTAKTTWSRIKTMYAR